MSVERPGRLGVGIIGAGRVGPVLGSALRSVGHEIVGITASTAASRERADALLPGIPVMPADELARKADLLLFAIPDDAIGPLVQGLVQLKAIHAGQLVVHTCGAHGAALLAPVVEVGAIPLAVHPVMTFTGTSLDLARLTDCPFAVTAAAPFLPIAQALAVEMGGDPFVISEDDRPLYHAALAHGANHLVTLISQSIRALAAAEVPNPAQTLRPLLEAALERVLSEGSGALTGPVARGDAGTLALHLAQLRAHPELGDVAASYQQLAAATAEQCQQQLNPADYVRIKRVLDEKTR